MTNNKGQELVTLEGTVVRVFAPEYGNGSNGKKYTRNKFAFKTLDGRDLYITKFGRFDGQLVGKDLRFQASKYNDTNYTVQGEVEEAGDLVGAFVEAQVPTSQVVSEPTVATSARRRGRPSKSGVAAPATTTPATETAVLTPVLKEVASLEDTAHEVVVNNLKRAENLLVSLHRTDYTTADIIAVGDMLGRTYVALRIESNKDRRMDSFNRR